MSSAIHAAPAAAHSIQPSTLAEYFSTSTNVNIGLALLSVILICLQYLVTSILIGVQRVKHFPAKYMRRFDELHMKEVHSDKAPQGGYPDMGDGRFAADLQYDQWF